MITIYSFLTGAIIIYIHYECPFIFSAGLEGVLFLNFARDSCECKLKDVFHVKKCEYKHYFIFYEYGPLVQAGRVFHPCKCRKMYFNEIKYLSIFGSSNIIQ